MAKNSAWVNTVPISILLLLLTGCSIFPPSSQVSSSVPGANANATASQLSAQGTPTHPRETATSGNVSTPTSEPGSCKKVPAPQLSEINASKDIYLSGIVDFCLFDNTQTSFDFDAGVLGSTDDSPASDIRFEGGGPMRLDGRFPYYFKEINYAYVDPSDSNTPSAGDCKKSVASPTRLTFVEVIVGATGCVVTNEGRLAVFHVEKLETLGSQSVEISFVVWKIPASALPPALPTPSPSPQPIDTPTSAFPASDLLQNKCMEISANLPAQIETQGMIVLDGNPPFLLDPKNGLKKTLRQALGDFSVSPDHQWLAHSFEDSQGKRWLAIETADGKQQKTVPWDEDHWDGIGGWLDNTRIWMSAAQGPDLALFNPFTGERRTLAGDFPGTEGIGSIAYHSLSESDVMYNPALTLAVYPIIEGEDAYSLVLWDVRARRVVAKIKHIFKGPSRRPVWSPDGTKVYIIESPSDGELDNIFSLSQDGQVHQITHFGELLDQAELFGLSLSPDGRKIAFWLSLGPSFPQQEPLAVLDLETERVINYCLTGPFEIGGLSYPVWSPDSRFLAVEHWYGTASVEAVLLDTQQGWAASLAKGMLPAGWMIENSSP